MSDVYFEILVSQLWEMWKEVVPEKVDCYLLISYLRSTLIVTF